MNLEYIFPKIPQYVCEMLAMCKNNYSVVSPNACTQKANKYEILIYHKEYSWGNEFYSSDRSKLSMFCHYTIFGRHSSHRRESNNNKNPMNRTYVRAVVGAGAICCEEENVVIVRSTNLHQWTTIHQCPKKKACVCVCLVYVIAKHGTFFSCKPRNSDSTAIQLQI